MTASNLLLFGAISTWLKPLWLVVVGFAVGVAVLMLLGALLRWVVPKVAAIGWTTSKEALSQPLFYVLLAIGVFGLLAFPFIPYNTLGEDIKMVKDEGLTLIMVLSIVLALWTASTSVADEIEGRTALTLLSKPVSRRQFILGKFLGILVPVAIMFLILGALFLASVSYKVVYEAKETSATDPTLADCQKEMLQIAPGLALSFMETMVLTAISVAISTRLPMLANLIICAAIYVLGHLMPALANSPTVGRNAFVKFRGRLAGRRPADPRIFQHLRRHLGRPDGAAGVPALDGPVLRCLQHGGNAGGAAAVRGPRSGLSNGSPCRFRQSDFDGLEAYLKRSGLSLDEVQLLKADYFACPILHQDNLIPRFFADVFTLRIFKPDGEGVSLTVIIYLHAGHTRTPSFTASVG